MIPEATEFLCLVDTRPAERAVQRFLEERPHLLASYRQSPLTAVVKQFPLGMDYRADFAFVHANSGGTSLHLVEIESPRARIFNKDDSFSQHFNGAYQQLRDWMGWCHDNALYLRETVLPILHHYGTDRVYVQGSLIMGRRVEISSKKRQRRFEDLVQSLPRRLHIRTFDGFAEEITRSAEWWNISRHVRLFSYQRGEFRPAQLATTLGGKLTVAQSR